MTSILPTAVCWLLACHNTYLLWLDIKVVLDFLNGLAPILMQDQHPLAGGVGTPALPTRDVPAHGSDDTLSS
jgi:hypothetical protein